MKNILKNIVLFLLTSIVIALMTIFEYKFYFSSIKIIACNFILEVAAFFYFFFEDKFKKVFKFIIKHRYIIALFVFIVLVIFKVNGSSIGFYDEIMPYDGQKSNIVLGKTRSIRSDEFVVHTPYYFSQKTNNYNKISNKMSFEGQDMIIGYNAPVKDVSALAKPFTWGYFINNEIGLSWYWCSKVILFILVSFELVMLLTKKNEKLSVIGSLLISFSPAITWWFIPHMADVVFWSMSLIVLAYHFLFNKNKIIRYLMSVLLALSLVTFILALFPSLQISIGILAFLLLIGLIIRDRKELKIDKKELIVKILILIVIFVPIIGYSVYTSLDALKYLTNTVYPGKRVSVGGDRGLSALFTSLNNIFLPYKTYNHPNNCEVANFLHLGFLSLLSFPFLFKKLRKEKDNNYIIGSIFVIVMFVQVIFMLVGFPEWLSKITLFSYINRMDYAYSFTSLLFTLWTISMIIKYPKFTNSIIKLIICLLFIATYYLTIDNLLLDYLPLYVYLAELLCILVISLLIMFNKQKLYYLCLFLLVVFSGFTVNPIIIGASPLLDHPVSKFIKEHRDGNYLSLEDFVHSAFILGNGANVPFATNFYPDYGKWELLDEDKSYDDVYNRYANQRVYLTEEETSFETVTPDYITINLNYNDIKKLKIKYLFIHDRDINEDLFKKYDIKIKIVYNNSSEKILIYELDY